MLVLTRKVGEGIAIGDDIKIVVMQIKGKQVRLGIKASSSTVVHREEVYQRIQDENRQAINPSMEAVDGASSLIPATAAASEQAPLKRQAKMSKKSE